MDTATNVCGLGLTQLRELLPDGPCFAGAPDVVEEGHARRRRGLRRGLRGTGSPSVLFTARANVEVQQKRRPAIENSSRGLVTSVR